MYLLLQHAVQFEHLALVKLFTRDHAAYVSSSPSSLANIARVQLHHFKGQFEGKGQCNQSQDDGWLNGRSTLWCCPRGLRWRVLRANPRE